jgi:Asp/Glu/hydantoin racemase|tara:strand:+ start:5318 stop:6064 length:747 start_codon:yes stop_codon:yes gene_type:complete
MANPKILVLNPNGTDIYDQATREVAEPAVSSDTEVVVRNLAGSVPRTAFLPAPSVLMNPLLEAVVQAEKDGFDAIVIACCDDPGLQDAKHLVSIPVTGPMEAAAYTAAPLGRLAVIAPRIESGENENLPTDSNWVRRHIHQYGMYHNFAGVRHAPCPHPPKEDTDRLLDEDIGKLCDIVRSGMANALQETGINQARLACEEDDANVVFFACTIWSGLLDPVQAAVPAQVLDPVATPVRFAEMLAKNTA